MKCRAKYYSPTRNRNINFEQRLDVHGDAYVQNENRILMFTIRIFI